MLVVGGQEQDGEERQEDAGSDGGRAISTALRTLDALYDLGTCTWMSARGEAVTSETDRESARTRYDDKTARRHSQSLTLDNGQLPAPAPALTPRTHAEGPSRAHAGSLAATRHWNWAPSSPCIVGRRPVAQQGFAGMLSVHMEIWIWRGHHHVDIRRSESLASPSAAGAASEMR